MSECDSIEKIQASIDASPFNAFCRIIAHDMDQENATLVMTMPLRPEMERLPDSGQMHGGPIACLIDTAGCYACMMVLGHSVPTVNFRTDYLRPVIDTSLRAVATVRRAGRSVAIADVDVFDDQDQLVAVGRGTYSSRAG
jgi:uncharacterized protein (TIGR00369 family)